MTFDSSYFYFPASEAFYFLAVSTGYAFGTLHFALLGVWIA
jgi:hypothetical protein